MVVHWTADCYIIAVLFLLLNPSRVHFALKRSVMSVHILRRERHIHEKTKLDRRSWNQNTWCLQTNDKWLLFEHNLIVLTDVLLICCMEICEPACHNVLHGGVDNLWICKWSPHRPSIELVEVRTDCMLCLIRNGRPLSSISYSKVTKIMKVPSPHRLTFCERVVFWYQLWKFLFTVVMDYAWVYQAIYWTLYWMV